MTCRKADLITPKILDTCRSILMNNSLLPSRKTNALSALPTEVEQMTPAGCPPVSQCPMKFEHRDRTSALENTSLAGCLLKKMSGDLSLTPPPSCFLRIADFLLATYLKKIRGISQARFESSRIVFQS